MLKLSFQKKNSGTLAPLTQSQETRNAIEAHLSNLTDWEYAVFDQCCSVSKSIMVSLAILEGQLDLTKAFECSRLEENYGMRRNGMIGGAFGHGIDCESARARLAAARTFINMLRSDTHPNSKALRERNSFRNPPKPIGKTLTKLLKDEPSENLSFV
jgi:hypothetical protein